MAHPKFPNVVDGGIGGPQGAAAVPAPRNRSRRRRRRGARGQRLTRRPLEIEDQEPQEKRPNRRRMDCEPDEDGSGGHSATPARAVTSVSTRGRGGTPTIIAIAEVGAPRGTVALARGQPEGGRGPAVPRQEARASPAAGAVRIPTRVRGRAARRKNLHEQEGAHGKVEEGGEQESSPGSLKRRQLRRGPRRASYDLGGSVATLQA